MISAHLLEHSEICKRQMCLITGLKRYSKENVLESNGKLSNSLEQ